MIEDAIQKLKNAEYTHRIRNVKNRKNRWRHIHEIFDNVTETKVDYVFFCTLCDEIIYNPTTSGNTTPFIRHVCKVQSKDGVPALLISKDQKDKLKSAAALFVAKDFRPYFAIECEGLLNLCTAVMEFGQRYPKATSVDLKNALPSRNTVRTAVCKIAGDVRQNIRRVMQMAKEQSGLAATTDCWTDDYKHHTYICITIHASVEEFNRIKQYKYVIYMKSIPEMVKTKGVIRSHFLKGFSEYGFNEEDVKAHVTILSDRGPNVLFGLNDFDRLNCYAHLVNNLVQAMIKVAEITEIAKNVSALTSYLKNTGLHLRLGVTLKPFSKTRWNSVYTMFKALLSADFQRIAELLIEKQRTSNRPLLPMLTVLEKKDVQAICNFLEPFKNLSDQLEGDKMETLHFVWPAYIKIQKMLEEDICGYDESYSTLVELAKTAGRTYLMKNTTDFEPKIHHKTAVVLHPLMKKLPNINREERERVYQEIEMLTLKYTDGNIFESNESNDVQSHQPRSKKNSPLLNEFFEPHDNSQSESQQNMTELQRYIHAQVEIQPDKLNLCDWWYQNKENYPNLFKMFLKYSSIPATSAPSERNFSASGLIVTDRRNSILPSNVGDLIIARNVMMKVK